jgi:MFS family permease
MTPGPLVVAVLAPFMGRIAAARGQRPLLVPGGLVTAAGALWLLTAAGGEAHWLAHWLPGSILTGLGVALCLPQLSSAALQGLPPDRFGSGSAGNQAIRNLASTLAVSLAVTLIGVPLTQGEAIAGFQRVWWVAVASGLATSLLSLPLRRAAPRPSAAGVRPVSLAGPAAPGAATAVAGGTAAPVPAVITATPAPAADGLDGSSPDRQVTVAD